MFGSINVVPQQKESARGDHDDWPEKAAEIEGSKFFHQKERSCDDEHYSPKNVFKVHGYVI